MTGKITYQGEPGAFSHQACVDAYPDHEPVGCATFDEAFAAVEGGDAELAMIPVENTVAGRVPDIHHLLPESPLHIIAEHFSPVRFQLLAPAGVTLDAIKAVAGHPMGLAQCRRLLKARGWEGVRELDNAGAARLVASGDYTRAQAAVASDLAGEIYKLEILQRDVQDDADATTRFIVLSRDPLNPKRDEGPFVTSFLFQVRNVPAALYKAMGGFATNGVNMTKLESYQIEGKFTATQFYADVEGHPDDLPLARALEELAFFSKRVRIVGVYPQHAYRKARAGMP